MSEPTLPASGAGAELSARYGDALMNTFGPPKRIFVRGEGVHLWDADGKDYLDFAGRPEILVAQQA